MLMADRCNSHRFKWDVVHLLLIASWDIMRFEGRDQMLLFLVLPTFIWDSRRKDRLHPDLKYTYFADRWQPLQSEHLIIKLCHCQWHYFLTDCLNSTYITQSQYSEWHRRVCVQHLRAWEILVKLWFVLVGSSFLLQTLLPYDPT